MMENTFELFFLIYFIGLIHALAFQIQ